MSPARKRAGDALVGAAVGCLVTLAVCAATLYVEVKTMNVRLTALENSFAQVTHIELKQSREGARLQ